MKQKILVMRYRFIGDTVLTIPFLRNLRKAYPDAQIDMLAGPVSGDVLIDCPYIDNLIIFDTTRKHIYENKNEPKKSFFNYIRLFRKAQYDKAYVLKRSFSSALLAYLSGIKKRIGFNTENRGIFLTTKVPYEDSRHEVDCFLDLLTSDNISVDDGHLENFINPAAEQKIIFLLNDLNLKDRKKVLVHATSGNTNKHWQSNYFAEVFEYLINTKEAQIFYTGTASDAAIYDEIISLASTLDIMPVNLCGKLSLQESTALIAKLDLVIGVDSGTLHIAASVNTSVIGIYKPMNIDKWKTRGSMHSPLTADIRDLTNNAKSIRKINSDALKRIRPSHVINAIDRYL